MQALVALFSDVSAQKIYRIWDQISVNDRISRTGVIPHLSWHVARQYSLPDVKRIIDLETNKQTKFHVTTTGMGIFRGELSYLYLPVTVNANLLELHKKIFQSVSELCSDCNEYFKPDIWVPHITIQFNPLTFEDVCQSIRESWELTEKMLLEVDSFGLIDSNAVEAGVLYRSYLKG